MAVVLLGTVLWEEAEEEVEVVQAVPGVEAETYVTDSAKMRKRTGVDAWAWRTMLFSSMAGWVGLKEVAWVVQEAVSRQIAAVTSLPLALFVEWAVVLE